ncbi:reductase [Arthrobacter sp. Hiyo4]|nr:reductase [Arthrobacter sp. Hiyo4]
MDPAAAKRPARASRPAAKPHGQWKVDGKTR